MRPHRWMNLLLLLLPVLAHAQRRPAKERIWEFHAGAWLLWNTVHGNRYVQPRPLLPGIPLRNVDMSAWRSFARNSFSPASGGSVERRLYRSIWLAGGLEVSQRRWRYEFDKDTLAAYPPVSPPPEGLFFQTVTNYRYQLDLPAMLELRLGEWSIASGLMLSGFIHSKGTGELLDGTQVVRHDIADGPRFEVDEAIPKVLLCFNGIGKDNRFRAMLGAEFREKGYGTNTRWVDVRFGASVRIGK